MFLCRKLVEIFYRRNFDLEEFRKFHKLISTSLFCSVCKKRLIIEKKHPCIEYCSCVPAFPCSFAEDDWVPYIDRGNSVVWRKPHCSDSRTYMYKVYGSYDDISAHTFSHVQLDTESRPLWDRSVGEVYVVESDELESRQLIYWTVSFPKVVSDRDYLFERFTYYDKESNTVTIVSRAAQHHNHPPRPRYVRVNDYWSIMSIRPHGRFDEPGLDFALTYFDNAGGGIPACVTNYAAKYGLPSFLSSIYNYAKSIERGDARFKSSRHISLLHKYKPFYHTEANRLFQTYESDPIYVSVTSLDQELQLPYARAGALQTIKYASDKSQKVTLPEIEEHGERVCGYANSSTLSKLRFLILANAYEFCDAFVERVRFMFAGSDNRS